MTILKKEKVRPDVLKISEENFKQQIAFAMEYANRHKQFKFQKIYKKVLDLNDKFFHKKAQMKELYQSFSKDELTYLVGLMRYAFEHYSFETLKKYPISKDINIKTLDLGDFSGEWQIPPDSMPDKVLLYLHGGGFIMGSPVTARINTTNIASISNISVLSVDYHLAPEYPFPTSLLDCIAAYKWLLDNGYEPQNIIIGGDSAGGNLTLAMLVKLRDDGVELPLGAICLSPAIDCTFSDEQFFKLAESDVALADIGLFWWIGAYVGNNNPQNSLISPIFADLHGLPPILIQASSNEMLYSDALRFFKKAQSSGITIHLQTWDGMWHVFQEGIIHDFMESKEAFEKIAEFIQKLFSAKK
jgi:monoterpene epsilon-lactone hydrolase